MKKKAFLFVIAALVLCLTCGMLLVACDKDDDNNNNNNNNNGPTSSLVSAESGEVMTAVINGLDEATKADDGEFAFSLEIVQSDMDAANYGTLFGLAYEKIGDDYFIYAAAGNGNYIKIRHANGIETCYSHNSKNLVKKGDKVKAGQVIALTGRTGRATTEHLHFECRVNGRTFDPGRVFDHANHSIRTDLLTFTKRGGGISIKADRNYMAKGK